MKFITLTLLLLSFTCHTQIKNWYGSDLSRLGVKFNNVKFKDFDNSLIQFKGRSSDFAADIITKNVYFNIDGTFLSDLVLVYALGLNRKDETWYDRDDLGRFDRVKFFPLQIGFGLPITRYGALYAGGQWQYSLYSLNAANNMKNFEARGHQFGLGIHGFASVGPVMIKQSYMKDLFSKGGGANIFETTVYAGYSFLGAYLRYSNQTYNEISNPVENQKLTISTFSIGIYAAGLFSGVSKGTAKAVGETERGIRNERNWKKRNTIEYKE